MCSIKLVFLLLLFPLSLQFSLTLSSKVLSPKLQTLLKVSGGSSAYNGNSIKFPEPIKLARTSNVRYIPRTNEDFITRDSRLGFVRKVYAILGSQVVTTVGITALLMNNARLSQFFLANYQSLALSTFFISTGIIFSLVTNFELRHTKPYNFILLGIHTILQALLVGTFSSLMDPKTVTLGAMHTLTTFVAITLYSFQPNPRYDLSVAGSGLLACTSALLTGSLLGWLFNMPVPENLLSGAMAVLFAVYLAHDTQKIVGGVHHKYQYGQKEYILASLNLYQDLLNFYLQVMKLLNSNRRKERERESF
jgi:protein lifeguard